MPFAHLIREGLLNSFSRRVNKMADGGSHRVGLELLGKCSKEEAEKVRERNNFFRKIYAMKFHVMHFSTFTFIMGNKMSCDVKFYAK